MEDTPAPGARTGGTRAGPAPRLPPLPHESAPELCESSLPSGPARQPRRGGSVPSGVPLPTGRTRRVALRARGSSGSSLCVPACPRRGEKGEGAMGRQLIAPDRIRGAVMGRKSGRGAEPSSQQQPGCASGRLDCQGKESW